MLDPVSHDLVVTHYDLSLADGIPLMQQRLKQSLLFFMGEWYLDVTDGVPYYQYILKKAPDRNTVESMFKATILETPGVTELVAFNLSYDNPIRSLYIDFKVKTIYGMVSMSEEI
ncbi:hypothetical protein ACFSC6_12310 [Rufibacter sediminis]|uniref:Uncharacterized protein n=1 Tax=Rufibacter sediminis TaxID=2762756 RepID=A0ABR6VVN5_9BACT|nr:hypothetical protein [Rufibacter sediminis]MBC3540666.1 hypothetical protein [Rufibacter sediminis]